MRSRRWPSQQADLFRGLNQTFGALAQVADPYIGQTIEKSPATLEAANRSLPEIKTFLLHSGQFFTALQPGAKALRKTSPVIASALARGADVLPKVPALNRELPPSAQALVDFQNSARRPARAQGPEADQQELRSRRSASSPRRRRSATTSRSSSRTWRARAAAGDSLGNFQFFFPITPALGPNSETSPASAPADGGEIEHPPELPPGPDRNYLHSNPYPNTASPGQTRECEAGRESWLKGRTVTGNEPGNQGLKTRGQSKLPGGVPK